MQPRKRLRMLQTRQTLHNLQLLAASVAADKGDYDAEQLREGWRRRRKVGMRRPVSLRQDKGGGALHWVAQPIEEVQQDNHNQGEWAEDDGKGGGRVRLHGRVRRRARLSAALPE